jgi:hypothetical protein
MKCPKCESEQIVKNGKVNLKDKSRLQKYTAHRQESRMPNYSRKGLKVLGNGQNRAQQSDGLQMENEDTARNYGN